MARRKTTADAAAAPAGRPSALLDTRVIYCGDCLDQLRRLPDGCVDLIYIDQLFTSDCGSRVLLTKRWETVYPATTGPATDRGG